jgi:hypothetical protein
MKKRKKILVIGDSHARDYFSSSGIKGKLKSKDQDMNFVQSDFHFDVYYVSGATAQGAVNPKSKTKALSIFKKRLNKINPNDYDYIAIMLGEVDCGFVIWYRSEKYSISVEEQLNLSVNNLFEFIRNEVLLKFKPKQVIVMGSVLPTIRDGQNYGKIARLRSSVKATQLERTNLTLIYNDTLKETSDKLGYNYIDITEDTINEDTQLIDDDYLNEDKNNHHLSFEKIWKFWINNLKGTLR